MTIQTAIYLLSLYGPIQMDVTLSPFRTNVFFLLKEYFHSEKSDEHHILPEEYASPSPTPVSMFSGGPYSDPVQLRLTAVTL